VLIEENYAKHTMWTVDVFRRWAKFSLIGIFAVGATTWTAFEGAHMWVEKMELVPDHDQETRRFGWDREAEKWSGGDAGGTDSALGWKGRHAVRSAWIAQNWGTGPGTAVIESASFRDRVPTGAGDFNVVDARLEYTHDFLNTAISIAEGRISSGRLHPQTFVELLTRHAEVLERVGSRNALFESRSQYERVWAGLPGKGIDSARIAKKLGDLNHRLGDREEALTWWVRAMQLTTSNPRQPPASILPSVPLEPPSTPLAQRTLASILVSMSAFYATSGQLAQAQTVQEASLDLLRSIPTPESLALASPPQALHSLYLLHRSALISIHHAEVLFALRSPINLPMQWLRMAAQSSERVALALTGSPATHPNNRNPDMPHVPSFDSPPLPEFSKSRVMSRPAKILLRDARRSAAESWNLLGILSETHSPNPKDALECYERALSWVGARDIGKPGEGITEPEWKALWANHARAKEAVDKGMRKS
jgi:tetratricopeptide (TPR) repeat protein